MPAAIVIFGLGAVALLWIWHTSESDDTFRRLVRGLYAQDYTPHVFKLMLANAPIWAAGNALIALGVSIPDVGPRVTLVGVMDTLAVALVAAYFRPEALMPRWLREEVALGAVRRAEPRATDWIYFWFLVPAGIAMTFLIWTL